MVMGLMYTGQRAEGMDSRWTERPYLRYLFGWSLAATGSAQQSCAQKEK